MATTIMPISDLRRKTREVVETVRENQTVYITQHGRPVMVLVEYEMYENLIADKPPSTLPAEVAEGKINYVDYLSGLHKEIWEDIDTDAYLQAERDAWKTSGMP